ncbi:uncharacterized protein LOC111322654 isoform X1 [Stylophora pistillata]|uniref:uncharacterized protein LOC111322654 isoform X1 n=1 Tax=Stylophora pistillata TaxID=50429 RepID=UPI000C040350|nr:uncharacterized protein LOC111322654 isoform X1 [Stylophora pistillata]
MKIDNLDSHFSIAEIITKEAPFGDLKSYVLANRCQIVDIVTFLSQVASAMHYLHVKNIIHGDLRATYVNVATHNKIQVGRLGRSKPLSLSEYEVTSTLCVVQAVMPPESTRWSAPEVILDGHYTHASDVWSFGILAWELYTSFADGLDGRDSSLPFFGLNNQEILPQIRDNGPPTRPEGCPEWVHIIMHQCWAYVPQQRPPFLAVFDCLTSREPMESWIMKLWLQNHDKSKWPDLSIRQPQDACHVTNSDQHPSSDVIEKMCSPDFFSKHEYKYVSRTFFTTSSDDDYSKAYGTSDMQGMRNDLEYQTACGECTTEEETPELVPVPKPQKTPNNDESGYLCPVSIKVEDLTSIESYQRNVSGVADFPKSHEQKNEVTSAGIFYLQVKKIKKIRVGAYDLSAIDADEDKVSLMEDNYVNLRPQPDQHHTAFYQNIQLVLKEGSCELEEDAKKAAAACEKPTEDMNGAVYCKVKKTKNPHLLKDQLVPLNHQLYANVEASSVTTHALPPSDMEGEQSDMETIHKEKEAEQHFRQTDEHSWNAVREKDGAEKNGSNSSLPVWLKDPELEVLFYV